MYFISILINDLRLGKNLPVKCIFQSAVDMKFSWNCMSHYHCTQVI